MGQTEADHSSVAMLTLASKLKRDDGGKTGRASGASDSTHRVSIRDRLLTKGTWVIVHFLLCMSSVVITLFDFLLIQIKGIKIVI